jgi:hypothetical protein
MAAVEEARIMGNPAARVGKFIGRSRTEVEMFRAAELTRLLQTAAVDRLDAATGRHPASMIRLSGECSMNVREMGLYAHGCGDDFPVTADGAVRHGT